MQGPAKAIIFDLLGALDRLIRLRPSLSTSGDAEHCGCRFQALVKNVVDYFLGPVIGNASQ